MQIVLTIQDELLRLTPSLFLATFLSVDSKTLLCDKIFPLCAQCRILIVYIVFPN